MRVGVIGAGGIGGLYGGLLARAGHDVSFLARGPHLEALRRTGLEVRSADFGTFQVTARASDRAAELGLSELLLFTVKTYDLEPAAHAALEMLAPDGRLLTFQNGVDAPDRVAAVVGAERVLIGTTALETTIVEPGVIGHLTPGHSIAVASFDGPPTVEVERIVAAFKDAGMNANVAADGHRALWEKALILIPMATLTSLCQSAMGPIRELPETRAFAEELLRDVARVAAAHGYELAAERGLAMLDRVPPTMKASMARDFERGRQTELEALTGALVRMASEKGVEIPSTRTAYAVLKLRAQQTAGALLAVGSPGRSE